MKAPVAIMSFNRPGYLAETLRSIKNQTDGSLQGREFHLFQDGAVNLYSKIEYADPKDISECIEIFKNYFPEGQVHFWSDNIGICETFYRAETYLFEERNFEFAYFFEDDLVLSPVYFEMMDVLLEFAERTPNIAYFSAYGDYYAKTEEINERGHELVNLDHHWAFGLRRTHWKKIRRYLSSYYKIVLGQDYARRDHKAIFELFAKSGVSPRGSSQDAAKSWACDQLGLWRCRTFAPFALYIGKTGAHMTEEVYNRLGFANTEVLQTVIKDLNFPDSDQVAQLLAEQRALYKEVFQTELPTIMAGLPAKKWNPVRFCTASDVRAAYRLLLNREPESQDVIDQHAGKTAIYSLIRGLIHSKEFLNLSEQIKYPW